MCSLVGTNVGVNTKKDYEQYSHNLKEQDNKILIATFLNDIKRQYLNKYCLKY